MLSSPNKNLTLQVPVSERKSTQDSNNTTSVSGLSARVEATMHSVSGSPCGLEDLNFDAFQYTYKDLRSLVAIMFEREVSPLFDSFQQRKLETLLLKTQAVYQHVPYHSFRHSVDVTQFVYLCIRNKEVRQMLTAVDLFCVLVTALMHDLGHCGVNNPVLSQIQHQLAKEFPGSPLEEFHAHLAQTLLGQKDCNILDCLSSEERQYFDEAMTQLILATDMKHHFSIKEEMDKCINSGLSPDNKEDRLLVMKLLLKCADLSNVTREFSVAREWAKRVVEEFSVIGDLQKEAQQRDTAEKIEIQKMFDRERLDFPESQVGFINFVAKGQFDLLSAAFPTLGYITKQVETNGKTWQEYAKHKDDEISSFEQNLKTLGAVIREPIERVLSQGELISKPVEDLSSELTEVETSLIQRRLQEQTPKLAQKQLDFDSTSSVESGMGEVNQFAQRSSSVVSTTLVIILGVLLSYFLYVKS